MSVSATIRMNYPEDMRVVITTSPDLDIRIEGRWNGRKRYQLFTRFAHYNEAECWLRSRGLAIPWTPVDDEDA